MYLVSQDGIRNSPEYHGIFNRLVGNLQGLNFYNIFEAYLKKRLLYQFIPRLDHKHLATLFI